MKSTDLSHDATKLRAALLKAGCIAVNEFRGLNGGFVQQLSHPNGCEFMLSVGHGGRVSLYPNLTGSVDVLIETGEALVLIHGNNAPEHAINLGPTTLPQLVELSDNESGGRFFVAKHNSPFGDEMVLAKRDAWDGTWKACDQCADVSPDFVSRLQSMVLVNTKTADLHVALNMLVNFYAPKQ